MVRGTWVLVTVLAGCAVTPQTRLPAASTFTVATPTPASTAATSTALATLAPLDSVLPIELGGVELHTFAVGQDILERLAARLGMGADQFDVRYASEHGARFLQMYALHAPRTGGPQLVDAWSAIAYPADVSDDAVRVEVIGGTTVTVAHSPSAAGRLGTFYAYSSGDTLLVVQAFDPEVAAEALSVLP